MIGHRASGIGHRALTLLLSLGAVNEASAQEACAGPLPLGESRSVEADAVIVPTGLAAGDLFGSAITVGDFNGDGLADFAIGAPGSDVPNATNAGAVHVYFGRLDLVPPCPVEGCDEPGVGTPALMFDASADIVLLGSVVNGGFGAALASAGDLTSDGTEELVVGGDGAAMVIDLSIALPLAQAEPWLEFGPAVPGAHFGHMVGSMEIDGESIIWVGEQLEKKIRIFHHFEDPGGDEPRLSIQWGGGNPIFTAVTAAGDWDNDNLADLAVGCSQCTVAQGNIKLFAGYDLLDFIDLSGTDAVRSLSGVNLSRTGASLADFSDGRLAIGATHQPAHGRVLVVDENVGVDANGVMNPVGTLVGATSGRLGWSVAVGDPNGDGVQDVVGGEPDAAFGNMRVGMVRFGETPEVSGTIASPMFMWGPPHVGVAGSRFGQAVAIGDVNGDLFDDVLIGAPKAQNGGEFGAAYLILGGDASNDGQPVVQFLDGDGDGVGAGEAVVRCTTLEGYAAVSGDCDDSDPLRNPGNIEICVVDGDEDCRDSNAYLCGERIATMEHEIGASLLSSTWCYGHRPAGAGSVDGWPIGPLGGVAGDERVSVQSLATLLDTEKLFFDDLDAGVVGATMPLESCAAPEGSVAVIMDVMEHYPTDSDVAASVFAGQMTEVVITTLRNHQDGYLIGTLSLDPPVIGIVGGGYPGLVNGVVELLRAVEGGASWHHQSVLDWPENPVRRLSSSPNLAGCTTDEDVETEDASLEASWENWEDCQLPWGGVDIAAQGREMLDLAVRYHFSVVRGQALQDAGRFNELLGRSTVRDTTHFREMILYFRRRGIDYEPGFAIVPGDAGGPLDPMAVEHMPFIGVEGDATPYLFPCDSDGCETIYETDFDQSGYGMVYSRKYLMANAGPARGIVLARNMLTPPSQSTGLVLPPPDLGANAWKLACSPAEVRQACQDGPCFCVDPASSVEDSDLLLGEDGLATLYLADMTLMDTSFGPFWAHDDGWYEMWSPDGSPGDPLKTDVFRPGRLYALHFSVAHETSLPVGVSVPITVVVPGTLRMTTTARLTDGVARNVNFVVRAPLQTTEMVADEVEPFYDPVIQIAVGQPTGSDDLAVVVPDLSVRVSNLTVVELDGLSAGWLRDDNGQPSVSLFDAEHVDPTVVTPGCGGVVGCVPYAAEFTCGDGPHPYANQVDLERFVRSAPPALAADSYTRFPISDLVSGSVPVSGVQRPIIGSFPVDDCTGLNEVGVVASRQSPEVLHPDQWMGGGRSITAQLRFVAEARTELSGHAMKDYMFGALSGDRFSWHSVDDIIFSNILSEVRGWNVGFPGWRDRNFGVLSQHHLARALLCNAANVVNDADWADEVVPFRTASELLADPQNPIEGDGTCDLVGPGSSGVKLVVDANMLLDSTTANYRASIQVRDGSLAVGQSHADLSAVNPSVDGGETIANTVASNVYFQVWNYEPEPHDLFENLCDVTDASELFYDQADVGQGMISSPDSRSACMLSRDRLGGRPAPLVYGAGALRSGDIVVESIRNMSAIAAGHPEIMGGVEARDFGADVAQGGAIPATFSEPLWGYAGRCMWNPGMATFAAVSVASIHGGGESRWCPAGTEWGGVQHESPSFFFEKDMCGDRYGYDDDAVDCVGSFHRVFVSGVGWTHPSLRLSVRPDRDAIGQQYAIPLPVEVEPGEMVSADTVVAMSVASHLAPSSCSLANSFIAGIHPQGTVLSGSVRIGIYFMNEFGNLLDENGNVLGQMTCDGQDPWSIVGNYEEYIKIYPKIGIAGKVNVFVSSRRLVPVGAAFVGIVLDVPNGVSDFLYPNSGTIMLSRIASSDPAIAPALHKDAADIYFSGQTSVPFGMRDELPHGCIDSAWYNVSMFQSSSEVSECLSCYMSNNISFCWP
jgi:hypothetical protein